MSLINTQVQPFKAQAFLNGKFVEVSDESMKGKWSVVIFMPAAFTFNCPTEVEDAAEHYAEFQKLGAEVYIVTTDTHFAHQVWHEVQQRVAEVLQAATIGALAAQAAQTAAAAGIVAPERRSDAAGDDDATRARATRPPRVRARGDDGLSPRPRGREIPDGLGRFRGPGECHR